MTCYFYINKSNLFNQEIIKIGISNNPEKRLLEFNNGIRHRSNGNYCQFVKFYRAFTIKFKNRELALKKEIEFKKRFKDKLLIDFGKEVFLMSVENGVKGLYDY